MGVELVQWLPPTKPWWGEEDPDKVICSGFDGFWLGSTPCLASNAAQGGPREKEIAISLSLKTSQEFCPRSSKAATLRYESCKVIC